MSFVKLLPGLECSTTTMCTAFNYDTIYFLTKNGPVIYSHSMGGYIAPHLGGNLTPPDWDHLKKSILEYNPVALVIPECYVNDYYPEIKQKFLSLLGELGFTDEKLYVYVQKEQNFYHKEIHVGPEWFYRDENSSLNKNLTYHTIGHNVLEDDPNFEKFSKFKFCRQGFMYESFYKLQNLKNTTFDEEFEKRKKIKESLIPYNFIFYGNSSTSIRSKVIPALLKHPNISFCQIKYELENITDLFFDFKGIGISMDGLVFNTIRDAEYSFYVTPNIKITRASEYVTEQNNVDMFKTRFIKRVSNNIFTKSPDLNELGNSIINSYDEYMSCDYDDYNNVKNNFRYQYFISMLQKLFNLELFIFDIMFSKHLKEMIDKLTLDIDYNILGGIAYYCEHDPEKLKEKQYKDYTDELNLQFSNFFKKYYNEWLTSLNIKSE